MYINRTEPREVNPPKRVITRANPEHASADGAADALLQEDAVELSSAVKDALHDEHHQEPQHPKKHKHPAADDSEQAQPVITVIDVKV